ncbi:hypothetical protein B0H14DRAFT_2644499 [Mycena olivaceomarginata]|nr:hypothetical protein B0H14DRAFT_2644499 [Mycena olivaceomarginata]
MHHVTPHNLSSLHVLSSVGEPINPEAWNWYNEHVGKGQCVVVDTFWWVFSSCVLFQQTEMGSIIIMPPFPSAVPTKPGCATVPLFWHEPVILDVVSGEVDVPAADVISGSGHCLLTAEVDDHGSTYTGHFEDVQLDFDGHRGIVIKDLRNT